MERWQTQDQIIPKALCVPASCAEELAFSGWCNSEVGVRLLTTPVIAFAWLHWFTREPGFDQTKGTALMCNVTWDGSIHSPLASVILGHTVIRFSIYFFLFISVRCISDQSQPAVENIWQNSAIVFVSCQVFFFFYSFFPNYTISFYFPYIKHSSS